MNYRLYILCLLLFTFSSCEEVVDIPLEETSPRLVVEASITWVKGSKGNKQNIILSTTAPFYDETTLPVEDAKVKIFNEEGETFEFTHTGDGVYVTDNFIPQTNEEYELQIMYKGEQYTAREKMIPVTDIDHIEQSKSGGFSGEDYEIKVYYNDPVDEQNYYYFIFKNDKNSIEIYEDEFTNGNQIFGYYSTEDIKRGDEIKIEMAGISRAYYDYLFVLRSQIGNNNGGPFETKPATVKGNIVNEDDKKNYPFGYFRLSEVDTTSYIVQ